MDKQSSLGKFTPGPWEVNEYTDCVYADHGEHHPIIADRPHGGVGKDGFINNAYLIASAPELLAALNGWINAAELGIVTGNKEGLDEAVMRSKAIISKAIYHAEGKA